MSQRERRQTPYPGTWEIPVTVAVTVLLLLVLGAHLGRSLANLIAGAGGAFPAPREMLTSLPTLLGGDAAAGLTPRPPHPAGTIAVRFWMGLVDGLLVVTTTVGALGALAYWGPGRIKGMASRKEAAKLLGPGRLRRNAAIIRPDLYKDTK